MEKVSDLEQLKAICKDVRKDIIEMIYAAGSGHPGGSLSATEMMVALFFNTINHDPASPDDPRRDRFVLSKGHCCPAYYSVLARCGYFDVDELLTFRKMGSRLQGHPDKSKFPLMETTSGSLGQGLSIAAGMAFALRLDFKENTPKVYCMIGDGELNEGQIWESLATVKKYNLDNLIIILDNNKVQLDGTNAEIKELGDLQKKFWEFGYEAITFDGNNMDNVMVALDEVTKPSKDGKLPMLIAHTIKGKGVSFMEGKSEWHGKAPNKEQYEMAMKELEG
jgi:transketolase